MSNELDYTRPDYTEDGCERHVMDGDNLTFRLDETDEWVNMPVRSVYDSTGWTFEIGPYSISGTDARKLINTLARYGEMSGDFRPRNAGDAA